MILIIFIIYNVNKYNILYEHQSKIKHNIVDKFIDFKQYY